MCQLYWATGYADVWLNIILSVSVRVFLDEIVFEISGLSKAEYPSQCKSTLSSLLKTRIEQKVKERRTDLFSAYLVWDISILLPLN